MTSEALIRSCRSAIARSYRVNIFEALSTRGHGD
jgi:hypothetical protein